MDTATTYSSVMPPNAISQPASTRDPIRTREVGWPIVVLYIGVSTGLLLLHLAIRRAGLLGPMLAGPAWQQNLFMFSTLLIIAIGGVVFGIGRLRPTDVGLRRDRLVEGLIVTAAVWLLMQVIAVVSAIATTGTIVVARTWIRNGVGPTLMWTAAMFLGAALYEEIAYRGFLFPQLYLKLRGSHRLRFWTALLLTQVLFATSHIPAHIALRNLSGSALWRQVVLQGVAGALLLLLYLRTRNLWIPIGIHGLANAPTPLVAGAAGWETFLIGLVVAWPWLARKPQHRTFARVEAAVSDPQAHDTLTPYEARYP
jgi:membrane protease YdiL (CAAX protease family)